MVLCKIRGSQGGKAENMLNEREAEKFLKEIRKSGSILGLDTMRQLMKELGNVQDKLRIIHVAGTNGKGSVCAMTASILREAGCRVGTYTSPVVFDWREQYQINGQPITRQKFLEVLASVKEGCERVKAKGGAMPTIFEVETAAAFLYFYRENCQIVILETGMGGERDATNIIRKPLVSVITSVSMDHMKFLGDSLEEIAKAKAGIIKEQGRAVALRPKQESVRRILEEVCRKKGAVLSYAEAENACRMRQEGGFLCFSYGEMGEIRLSMRGAYQVENSICAIETVKILRGEGWKITDTDIKMGLKHARWEGRFSVVCQRPLFLMDGAHNEDAAKKLYQTLEMGFTNEKIIYIIGVLADKDYGKMLEILLPLAWKVYTVTPDSPRALQGEVLAEEAEKYHGDVTCCSSVREAAEDALALGEQEEAMILAFGSLSYLREVKDVLTEKRNAFERDSSLKET